MGATDRSAALCLEPGREQLVEELGVALDAGRLRGLHALADKKAHDLRVAVPVLPDLVRATTEDLIHHRLEGSAVRALAQSPLVHDPLGVRVCAVHDLKDLAGLGEADRIGRK